MGVHSLALGEIRAYKVYTDAYSNTDIRYALPSFKGVTMPLKPDMQKNTSETLIFAEIRLFKAIKDK